MKKNKEEWTKEIFLSMEGGQRAKPRPELFLMIEKRIEASTEIFLLPLQMRYAATIAIMILFMNIIALYRYIEINTTPQDNAFATEAYHESLINSYQIYEQ